MQYEEAKWLKDVEDLVDVEKQKDIKITSDIKKKQLRKSPNWKAPVPGLQ
mgnify:CR=1